MSIGQPVDQNGHVNIWHRRVMPTTAIAVAALMMSACAAGPVARTPVTDAPSQPASEVIVSPDPQQSAEPQTGAADVFRAWVEASRIPDVDTACAALAPDLQSRMIAEVNASGAVSVETCEQMIAAAAELYAAVGDDGAIDVAVQQETATNATLFVTYLASGDCGTVVMQRTGTEWIITDESQECAG
ncbi:Glutamyl-tRNA reductase [Microbacterium sp. C448]|nr:Glutamyl-tRNA reductase [Microbacterium sp. C448]